MFPYQAPRDLLRGQVILVTGAGRGIGRTAALAFAQHGAELILGGRNQGDLESLYDEIVARGGPEPAIQLLDLERLELAQCEAIAEALAQQYGCLHGLLHNAAMLGTRTPIEHYDPATWQQLMQVNVNAAFLLTRSLLPLLRRAPQASVLFTGSSVGRRGRAYWGAYAVTKFAIEGLTQVLAEELEATSAVRVNCINPGPVRTDMRRAAYPAENPADSTAAEDIMAAYLYLMGPDSASLNGRSIDAQGGQELPV